MVLDLGWIGFWIWGAQVRIPTWLWYDTWQSLVQGCKKVGGRTSSHSSWEDLSEGNASALCNPQSYMQRFRLLQAVLLPTYLCICFSSIFESWSFPHRFPFCFGSVCLHLTIYVFLSLHFPTFGTSMYPNVLLLTVSGIWWKLRGGLREVLNCCPGSFPWICLGMP